MQFAPKPFFEYSFELHKFVQTGWEVNVVDEKISFPHLRIIIMCGFRNNKDFRNYFIKNFNAKLEENSLVFKVKEDCDAAIELIESKIVMYKLNK